METPSYGFLGRNVAEDLDFAAELTQRGIVYTERTVAQVGTADSLVTEFTYQRDGAPRAAYQLVFRTDIDSWYTEVYVFSRPVPDDHLADVIEVLRQHSTEREH